MNVNAANRASAPRIVGLALGILSAAALSGCHTYDIVIEEDTVEYYEEFIRLYPTDPLAVHVRRKLGIRKEMIERAGLTCNKNSIPFDPEKPFVTSGIRLGTSAGTTRGFGEAEFAEVGRLILLVLNDLAKKGAVQDEAKVRAQVRALCAAHPIYAD